MEQAITFFFLIGQCVSTLVFTIAVFSMKLRQFAAKTMHKIKLVSDKLTARRFAVLSSQCRVKVAATESLSGNAAAHRVQPSAVCRRSWAKRQGYRWIGMTLLTAWSVSSAQKTLSESLDSFRPK